MKIHAVIVTYGDRFNLLSRVIDSCFINNIHNLTIVDNNSASKSKNKLKALANEEDRIKVIWNKANLGSAKAYKQALLSLNSQNDEYIIMLDDDNMLKDNSINVVKRHWNNKRSKETVCLLIYRPDREIYKKAIQLEDPDYVLSPINSFYGFDFFEKLIPRKKRKFNTKISSGKICYSPYGGMFFHQSLLKEIGYPNEDFFLYSDDHEWSYRITKKGFVIELITETEIEDIDRSWALKSNSIFRTIKQSETFRIYYTIRNRVYFEIENRVDNKARYYFNIIVFIFVLFAYSNYNTQFKVFVKAIRDGLKRDLSKKANEYINC